MLNLDPNPPIFSNEDTTSYWGNGLAHSLPVEPPRVPSDLLEMLGRKAPHLKGSFALSAKWWNEHCGTPEAHVSLFD